MLTRFRKSRTHALTRAYIHAHEHIHTHAYTHTHPRTCMNSAYKQNEYISGEFVFVNVTGLFQSLFRVRRKTMFAVISRKLKILVVTTPSRTDARIRVQSVSPWFGKRNTFRCIQYFLFFSNKYWNTLRRVCRGLIFVYFQFLVKRVILLVLSRCVLMIFVFYFFPLFHPTVKSPVFFFNRHDLIMNNNESKLNKL